MAEYRVLIKPSAAKEIDRISPKKIRQQIVARIAGLANDPRPPGCQKLAGGERYRIRQGRYRVLYRIEDEPLIVFVVKVAHRREAYR